MHALVGILDKATVVGMDQVQKKPQPECYMLNIPLVVTDVYHTRTGDRTPWSFLCSIQSTTFVRPSAYCTTVLGVLYRISVNRINR